MKTDENESKINISKRKESPSENSASPVINNKNMYFPTKIKSSLRNAMRTCPVKEE